MAIAHDNSINDPNELRMIENAIIGPRGELTVRFVDHAAPDPKAMGAQRKRIEEGSDEVERPYFKCKPYIEKKHKGQKDFVAKPATEKDKREFPEAWAEYQAQKDTPPKHSIQLLPGNDVCTQAVFNELNIVYIEDFLTFTEEHPEILEVFDELVPLLEAAKRWRTFMKPRLKLVNGKPE